jgi:pleiotropic regulator 1
MSLNSSLDAEAGIFALGFDLTGSRLVTCEADKTLKIWAEDSEADEESHPIDMKTWSKQCRQYKRF